MKKLAKLFFYVFLSIYAVIFFLPKEKLFYLAEHKAKEQGLVISKEFITDSGFSFTLKDFQVYFKDIQVSNINEANLTSYLFYNEFKINTININKNFSSFVPETISDVLINYSILEPKKVLLEAKMGKHLLKGNFDILEQKLHVEFLPKGGYRHYKFLQQFKQKDGKLIYEKIL